MWSQLPDLGWEKPKLLIGGGDDANTHLRQIARFIRGDNEAERRRVHDDKIIAAISSVHLERPQARDLEGRVKPVGKRGHVFDADPLGLSVMVLRRDRDEAARRLQCARWVSGSCISRMPASSRTVATQIEFEPDIGGVSWGSMMIKPCALSDSWPAQED
jgi:hypothetical protein